MTRKDYVALAAALKLARDVSRIPERAYGVERAALHIADTLAADNPRFDRARFLAACGVQS